MQTRNIHLREHLDSLTGTRMESESFSDASEVTGGELRLREQHQAEDKAEVEWLRNAAQKGIDAIERGDYTTLRSRAEIGTFVRNAGSARR